MILKFGSSVDSGMVYAHTEFQTYPSRRSGPIDNLAMVLETFGDNLRSVARHTLIGDAHNPVATVTIPNGTSPPLTLPHAHIPHPRSSPAVALMNVIRTGVVSLTCTALTGAIAYL